MAGGEWICGACRSVNDRRSTRCYRCRTPKQVGEADPNTLMTAGVGGSAATVDVSAPIGRYRSSWIRAYLTILLILAAISISVAASLFAVDALDRLLAGERIGEEISISIAGLALGGLGLSIAALVAWAAWLSRVVDNIPAVGLGFPKVTPRAAFFEHFIPLFNLFRIPAILRDVMNRLAPDGRGDALIASAWLGLVGGWLVPRIGTFLVVLGARDEAEAIERSAAVGQVSWALTAVGALFLIAIVLRSNS